MASSIKVQQSRFALLKIEDDEEELPRNKNDNSQQMQSANKRKQNKKRKHKANAGQSGNNKDKSDPAQWEEWKEKDSQITADEYEKDLEQALLLSKLEFEKKKSNNNESECNGGSNQSVGDGKKMHKKEKKDKPVKMTLDQFNQLEEHTSLDEIDVVEDPSKSKRPDSSLRLTPGANSADKKFFDNVEDDVQKIIRKEKLQEEYQKQYAVESALTGKYQTELRKKDKEIEFLRATVSKLESDLRQTKKRNQQLSLILAQGEMKDKAEVLLQVNQLSEVKDELTEQVTQLNVELEKERSKVHSLKTELDKIKVGKHGK